MVKLCLDFILFLVQKCWLVFLQQNCVSIKSANNKDFILKQINTKKTHGKTQTRADFRAMDNLFCGSWREDSWREGGAWRIAKLVIWRQSELEVKTSASPAQQLNSSGQGLTCVPGVISEAVLELEESERLPSHLYALLLERGNWGTRRCIWWTLHIANARFCIAAHLATICSADVFIMYSSGFHALFWARKTLKAFLYHLTNECLLCVSSYCMPSGCISDQGNSVPVCSMKSLLFLICSVNVTDHLGAQSCVKQKLLSAQASLFSRLASSLLCTVNIFWMNE